MLLVVFKMTAAEALKEFTNLVGVVFKDIAVDPNVQTEKLKRVIEDVLSRHGIDKTAELVSSSEPSPACKLCVVMDLQPLNANGPKELFPSCTKTTMGFPLCWEITSLALNRR